LRLLVSMVSMSTCRSNGWLKDFIPHKL
jgi:hypothetical protein